MCKRPIGTYTERGLLKAITVFEERTGMNSDEFERRFASGELDGEFLYNVWHQLLGELRTFNEAMESGDEELVEHVRKMVPRETAAA